MMNLPEPMMHRRNLRTVNPERTPTRHELVAHAAGLDVQRLPPERMALLRAKERICVWLLARNESGVSLNHAYELLRVRTEVGSPDERAGSMGNMLIADMRTVACGNKEMPSRSVVLGWVKRFAAEGLQGLASGHWFRERKTKGWEAVALQIYSAPGGPSMAAVARDLKRKHGFDVTAEQVRGYLKALPVHLGERNSLRLGRHLFKQTETPYVRRNTLALNPGDIYMADGYRADCYIAHPMTGDIWRMELMHVIDVKTGVLAGYRVMAHEGSFDVMQGWANIFAAWGHVPLMIYVDNGAGYKNRIASDETLGYYQRAGVQRVIYSRPKNARGKGNIERYHRVARDDFFKTWKPDLYCGPDMAKDALDDTVRAIKAGRLQLPSLQEFIDAYDAWLRDDYHQRPARDNKAITRMQAWQQLQAIAPHATAQEIARPCVERTVNRAAVRLNNREYMHPDLMGWNLRTVRVEFDILNHGKVAVRDQDGHLICDAPLVKTIGIVGDSILADTRQAALEAAVKRQTRKLREIEARAGLVIDVDATAQVVLEHDPTLLLDHSAEAPTDAEEPLDFSDLYARGNAHPTQDNTQGDTE